MARDFIHLNFFERWALNRVFKKLERDFAVSEEFFSDVINKDLKRE